MTLHEQAGEFLVENGWKFESPKNYKAFLMDEISILVFLDYAQDNYWHVTVLMNAEKVATKLPVSDRGIVAHLAHLIEFHKVKKLLWVEQKGPCGFHEAIANTRRCRSKNRKPEVVTASIYFIQPVVGGAIKIGWAVRPKKRLRDLQRMSPIELTILATIPGSLKDEHAMHVRFRHARSHGEWFHPSDDLLEFIGSLQGKAVLS